VDLPTRKQDRSCWYQECSQSKVRALRIHGCQRKLTQRSLQNPIHSHDSGRTVRCFFVPRHRCNRWRRQILAPVAAPRSRHGMGAPGLLPNIRNHTLRDSIDGNRVSILWFGRRRVRMLAIARHYFGKVTGRSFRTRPCSSSQTASPLDRPSPHKNLPGYSRAWTRRREASLHGSPTTGRVCVGDHVRHGSDCADLVLQPDVSLPSSQVETAHAADRWILVCL
jgi:hypothetical protein